MKINICQPRLEPWLDFFDDWCSGHFFLEVKIIKFKLAMLPVDIFSGYSSSDANIILPLSSCQPNLFIFLQSIVMHRGRRKLLRSVRFLMETVPESHCTNRMKSMKLSFEFISEVHVQIFATKGMQRQVHNTLINSSTAERNNCRSLG